MKLTQAILLGLAACLQFNPLQAQQSPLLKVKKQFILPKGVTFKDYTPKTIVFKLKPEFRSIGGQSKIQNEKLDQILNYIGVSKFERKFPNHQPPREKYNSLGQAYADLSLIYELKYEANVSIEDASNLVLSSGLMDFAEPHYIYQLHNVTPNDPSITNQSGFLTRIRAYAAWDLALGGSQGTSSVVIGIVDSGTDIDHPDLVSQFALNTADPINGTDDDADGYIDNYRGYDLGGADYNNVVGDNNPNILGNNNNHGSHVSGCASAATNNTVGVAGIGWNCKLLPIKCAADNDTRGSGGVGYIIAGYEGITYAADHGAQIINCSWGGPGGGSFGQVIVDYATINKNCLVIASAGNSGIDEQNFPASYNYVLSVAATNSTNDNRTTFTTYHYDVDISTPGNNIYTTLYNNTYGSMSGTSMSAPITAGGAGLVQSKYNYTNALQIGQRLKQTSDYHYAMGPNITGTGNTSALLANKLGKGRMNLQRALNDAAAPSVVFSNQLVDDHNDNAFVVGDSLFITGLFTNYLAPTTNLVGSIKAVVNGNYLTVVDTTTSLGALATLSSTNNNADPFKFKINAGTPLNTNITFQVTLRDGSYVDKYFFTITINVDYINIAINDVATTITSKGKIGYNADGQLEGLGFKYMGTDLLYEASLMVGSSATKVSDAFRGSTAGTADADFQSSVVVSKTVPGIFSEFDVHGRFNDALASPVQNLSVNHSAYAWTTTGHRKYVIVEYVMKNTGATALTNLYAGIAADWDIDANTASSNKGDFDATRNLGYVFSTATGGKYAGIKNLTNTSTTKCYHIDNTGGATSGGINIIDNTDYFSTSEKYTSLSTNRYQAAATPATGVDVVEVVSSGPYTINAGDSTTVAFALIAGDDLNDIQQSADSAQANYDESTVTGIKHNITNDFVLAVYPNPANNQLNFAFTSTGNETFEIVLVNMLGETVKRLDNISTSNGYNKLSLSVNDLSTGTYFYQLKSNNKTSVGKVIISK